MCKFDVLMYAGRGSTAGTNLVMSKLHGRSACDGFMLSDAAQDGIVKLTTVHAREVQGALRTACALVRPAVQPRLMCSSLCRFSTAYLSPPRHFMVEKW